MRFKPCNLALLPLASRKGGDVLPHSAFCAHKSELADMHELMHSGHAADSRVIPHMYVSGQHGSVGDDHAVTKQTVMRHMHIGHEQAASPHTCQRPAPLRTAMHGNVFTNCGVVADDAARFFPLEFQILGFAPNGCVGMHATVASQRGVTEDLGIGFDDAAFFNDNIALNEREGSDADIIRHYGLRIDNCCWMNQGHKRYPRSVKAAANCASTTTFPSTFATAFIFHTLNLFLMSVQ